ncbi:MAG: glutamate---cysteine ligase / carboxylate-amine ligase [Thermoleophilaceae bacterium]|nr:glutamate---cysteine ligase / carboxylate-amine ligase [Thermoleophilaceae bacterium]
MTPPSPDWAVWQPTKPYSLGAEEEVMLLDPRDWSLAQEADHVLPRLSPELAAHVTAETHGAAVELGTGVHRHVSGVAAELRALRAALEEELYGFALRVASAGTHPFAVWQQTVISSGERYQAVYGSMRALARREPTFALHVHVGITDPETAIRVCNRMRAHLPLLLATSVNSPFWQGRDTGLASARTPLFQAFPRVGIPRAFRDYEEWVSTVDLLIRCEAFPEPTFLWWDVRPQPRFGTVEVRILDAQTTVADSAALCALVQCLAKLEAEEGYASDILVGSPEVLAENRFLAARDGMDARLVDPALERPVPARLWLEDVMAACVPHARELGCETELDDVRQLAGTTGTRRQLNLARGGDATLERLVAALADTFLGGDPLSSSSSLTESSSIMGSRLTSGSASGSA